MVLTLLAALVAAQASLAPVPAADRPATPEADVRAAIVRAVRERVGECTVTVDALRVRGAVTGEDQGGEHHDQRARLLTCWSISSAVRTTREFAS